MGPFVNRPIITVATSGIATIIIALNVYLLYITFLG